MDVRENILSAILARRRPAIVDDPDGFMTPDKLFPVGDDLTVAHRQVLWSTLVNIVVKRMPSALIRPGSSNTSNLRPADSSVTTELTVLSAGTSPVPSGNVSPALGSAGGGSGMYVFDEVESLTINADALLKVMSKLDNSAAINEAQRWRAHEIVSNLAGEVEAGEADPTTIIARQSFIAMVEAELLEEHVASPFFGMDKEQLSRFYQFLFPKKHQQLFTLRKVIDRLHIPHQKSGFLGYHARKKRSQISDLMELIFFIPFLALFTYVALGTKGIAQGPTSTNDAYNVVSAINSLYASKPFDVGCPVDPLTGIPDCRPGPETLFSRKTFHHVGTLSDVYGFLTGPLVRTTWPSTGPAHDSYIGEAFSLTPVGAMKIRTVRVAPSGVDRVVPQYMQESSTRYPDFQFGTVDKAPFGLGLLVPDPAFHYRSCSALNASTPFPGKLATYSCDGHADIIPFSTTRAEARRRIEFLKSNGWIDVATRALFVEFFVFHPSSGVVAFVQFIFEFSASGGIVLTNDVYPFKFSNNVKDSGFDDFLFWGFYVVLACYIAFFIRESYRRVSTQGCTLEAMFPTAFEFLDLVNYLIFLSNFVIRLASLSALGVERFPVDRSDSYPTHYEQAAFWWTVILYIEGANVLISFIRMFKFVRYVPGLDDVIDILNGCKTDFLAVLVLLGVIFFPMVLCAHIVYGDVSFDFSTIVHSMQSLMLYFVSQFEFEVLRQRRLFAPFFFLLFEFLLVFIMFNMMVAVFTEAFVSFEQSGSFDADEIWAIAENDPTSAIKKANFSEKLRGHPWFATVRYYVASCRKRATINRSPLALYKELQEAIEELGSLHSLVCARGGARLITVLNNVKEKHVSDIDSFGSSVESVGVLASGAKKCLQDHLVELVGEFSYSILMSCFVFLPGSSHGMCAPALLVEALESHREFMSKRETIVVEGTTELESVEIRLMQLVQKEEKLRGGGGEALDAFAGWVANSFTATAAGTKAGKMFEGMSQSKVQFLLSLVAQLTTNDFSVLDRRRKHFLDRTSFVVLFRRCVTQSAGGTLPPPSDDEWNNVIDYQAEDSVVDTALNVYDVLELDGVTIHLQQAHAVMHEILRERYFACAFNHNESCEIEDFWLNKCAKGQWTKEEFKAAWEASRSTRSPPLQSTVDRIFSTSASKMIGVREFLTLCTSQPAAHSQKSVHYHYYLDQHHWVKNMIGVMIFVPMVAFFVAFVVMGAGRAAHVTTSVTNVFRVPAVQMGCENNNCSFSGTNVLYHLDLDSVDTLQEMRTWVKRQFLPNMWSGNSPTSSASTFDFANVPIGAIKVRQRRVPHHSCSSLLSSYYTPGSTRIPSIVQNGTCVGTVRAADTASYFPTSASLGLQANPLVQRAFRYSSCDSLNGAGIVDMVATYQLCDGHGTTIPVTTTKAEAEAIFSYLFDGPDWIDEQTRYIAIHIPLYSVHTKQFTVATFGFETSAGGLVAARLMMGVAPRPIDDLSQPEIACLVLFVPFFLGYVLWYGSVLSQTWKLGSRSVVELTVGARVALLFSAMIHSTSNVLDTLLVLWMTAVWAVRTTILTTHIGTAHTDYPPGLEQQADAGEVLAVFDGLLIVVLFLRLIGFLHFNRDLAILPLTVKRASNNIVSAALLFFILMIAFTFTGHLLYGAYLQEFQSVQNSITTVTIMLLGQIPLWRMWQVRRLISGAYIALFLVLCFFVMLQLIIAILTDAYSQIKRERFRYETMEAMARDERIKMPSFFQWLADNPLVREVVALVNRFKKPADDSQEENGFSFDIPGVEDFPPFLQTSPRRLWKVLLDSQIKVDLGSPVEMFQGSLTLIAAEYSSKCALQRRIEAARNRRKRGSTSSMRSGKSPAGGDVSAADDAFPSDGSAANSSNEVSGDFEGADLVGEYSTAITAADTEQAEEIVFSRRGVAAGRAMVMRKRRMSTFTNDSFGRDSEASDAQHDNAGQSQLLKVDGGSPEDQPPSGRMSPVDHNLDVPPMVGERSTGIIRPNTTQTTRSARQRKYGEGTYHGEPLSTVDGKRVHFFDEEIFYRLRDQKSELLDVLVNVPSIVLGRPPYTYMMRLMEVHHDWCLVRSAYLQDTDEASSGIDAVISELERILS